MIGKLTGKIDSILEDRVILDVMGVGYVVFAPVRVLRSLPDIGGNLSLLIETQVREDSITLFGFQTPDDQAWFLLLQQVQGVGPKAALSILSVLSPTELTQAIQLQDKTSVTRAAGVGPKLAARIVAELKDKMPKTAYGLQALPSATTDPAKSANPAQSEAISALIHLGYKPADAAQAVGRALTQLGSEAKTDALIRLGLKEISA